MNKTSDFFHSQKTIDEIISLSHKGLSSKEIAAKMQLKVAAVYYIKCKYLNSTSVKARKKFEQERHERTVPLVKPMTFTFGSGSITYNQTQKVQVHFNDDGTLTIYPFG